ncbi:hypothetical protein ScPMuIL_001289 [Solemya velum]
MNLQTLAVFLPLSLLVWSSYGVAEFKEAGFTKDGKYIGRWPGGCIPGSKCPLDEHCIHFDSEMICPEDHKNECSCCLGCVYENALLRIQQWRELSDGKWCMCENPTDNKVKCQDYPPWETREDL